MRVDQALKKIRRDMAVNYAEVEIFRHQYRQEARKKSKAANYFMSTEHKRHLSSLLLIAAVSGKPVTKARAATALAISRTSASRMLDEVTAAGWAEKCGEGYRFTDEQVEEYFQTIPEMLTKVSPKLTKTMQHYAELTEILSLYVTLTPEENGLKLGHGGG